MTSRSECVRHFLDQPVAEPILLDENLMHFEIEADDLAGANVIALSQMGGTVVKTLQGPEPGQWLVVIDPFGGPVR